MKRKTFLTILIGVVVLVVIAIIGFLLMSFWSGDQTGQGGSGFSLFPGRSGGVDVPQTPGEQPQTPAETPGGPIIGGQDVPRLRRLADFPVVALAGYYRAEKVAVDRIIETPAVETVSEEGETIIETPATTETVTEILDINQLYARYIRHEDGAVFTNKITNNLEEKQTTLGNIPYAGDGAIGNNGNSVVYRFFNDNSNTIETFVGTINEKVIPPAVCAAPLPSEITADSDETIITLLQEFLIYETENETLESNGILDTATRNMLRTFQEQNGLDRTGNADSITMTSINNRCALVVEERITAQNPTNIDGFFLTENITAMAVSPSTEDLVYFAKSETSTNVATLNFPTRVIRQVFETPFSEWTPYWTSNTAVTIHTKPSGTVDGYLYSLNTETGDLTKLEDGIRGLGGIISPSEEKVFVSGANTSLINKLLDTTNGSDPLISFRTLPEKCVWSQDSVILYCAVPDFVNRGLYPDDWYKGKVSFTDSIWSLNTTTGETRQIADLSREGGEEFDVVKPSLEDNELYMFFINKRTGEPWILEL